MFALAPPVWKIGKNYKNCVLYYSLADLQNSFIFCNVIYVTVSAKTVLNGTIRVWLLWRVPRLRIAWGSSHCWDGIFFCIQVVCV